MKKNKKGVRGKMGTKIQNYVIQKDNKNLVSDCNKRNILN